MLDCRQRQSGSIHAELERALPFIREEQFLQTKRTSMVLLSTALGAKGYVVERLCQSGASDPTLGGSTTCMEMSMSGVRTGLASSITRKRRKTTLQGNLQLPPEYFVEAPMMPILDIAVLRTALSFSLTIRTPGLGFVLCCRCQSIPLERFILTPNMS